MPYKSSFEAPSTVRYTEYPDGSRRILALDALRGFDMFWIVGGGTIVRALDKWGGGSLVTGLRTQLEHVAWAGFRFYDLIFPLFVFLAGVAAVFSLSKAQETGGKGQAAKRLLLRGTILFLVGVFYSGGLANGLDGVRWMGVLQRIALTYTAAGILFLYIPWKYLLGVTAGLLVGYWLLVTQSQVRNIQLEKENLIRLSVENAAPAVGASTSTLTKAAARKLFYATQSTIKGPMEPGLNVVNHFDFQYLPGRHHDTYYDPEGILSTFPGIATCLLGIFAGLLLAHREMGLSGKTAWLVMIGFGCLALGSVWSLFFPMIKKIWSSSFVLVAGGFSFLLLAFFHQVVDVFRWRRWASPFVWIGSNALPIYIVSSLGLWRTVSERIFGGPIANACGRAGELVVTAGSLTVMFLFARFLYKRGVFFRI